MSTFRIDLSDLMNNLDFEAELTEQVVKDVKAKVALDLLAGLQAATPVDTGQARNGWQIEGDNASVSNSVPYIGRLNDGSSTQAPAGFVEGVIDAVVAKGGGQ